MARVSAWLWIALAGTVLQVVSLGTNFYLTTGEDGSERARDAWFGIAHASEFMLAVAVITIALTVFAALGRSLFGGRKLGFTIGTLGLLVSAHIGYRMIAPPFDFGDLGESVTMADLFNSCLGYCSPAQAGDAELLPGIFIALAGCLLVMVGGFAHAMTRRAAATEANFWRAEEQGGLTPWMTAAGAGAIGQFVFGYTFFAFYLVTNDSGTTAWAGWFPTPHTAVMVLWSSAIVLVLAVAAARGRAPINPSTVGAVTAVMGFLSASRIGYRMLEPPFGGGTVPADVGVGAILSIVSAGVVIGAGIAQAATHREPVPETSGSAATVS